MSAHNRTRPHVGTTAPGRGGAGRGRGEGTLCPLGSRRTVLPVARVLVLLPLEYFARLDLVVAPSAHQLGAQLERLGFLLVLRGSDHRHPPRESPEPRTAALAPANAEGGSPSGRAMPKSSKFARYHRRAEREMILLPGAAESLKCLGPSSRFSAALWRVRIL